MAVEAHHLLHTGGGAGGQRQVFAHAGWAWAGDAGACYDQAPASAARHGQQRNPSCYGGSGGKEVVAVAAAAGRPACQQFQQSPCAGLPAPAPSSAMASRQYAAGPQQLCAADASESGVTFGGGAQQQEVAMAMAPRKRKRADQAPVLGLGAADVSAHFQQQLVDVDRLVLQHTTKMSADLRDQRRRHARQVVAAVEAAAAKRLRAKDEEIERMGRINWALEERVKTLYVEAQVWRDLAQSNEAAAAALRGELQQAMDTQQARCGGVIPGSGGGADADAGDAESCCCGENDVGAADNKEEDEQAGTTTSACRERRMCTMCGEGVADVLLLPCRHLCACAACAVVAQACPVCGCAKNGSVCVNFS